MPVRCPVASPARPPDFDEVGMEIRREPMSRPSLSRFILAVAVTFWAGAAFAKQGVVRNLYTVPNMTFVEQVTGESVITINDTSGSIASVQASIDSARAANPSSVILIYLQRGAVYTVGSAGLVLGSNECLVA